MLHLPRSAKLLGLAEIRGFDLLGQMESKAIPLQRSENWDFSNSVIDRLGWDGPKGARPWGVAAESP